MRSSTHILETVSGEPYADYVQTHIFEPLGMANSGYEVPQAVIPHLAQGYLYIGKDIHLEAETIDMSRPQGAGGLYSTLEDLATWTTWLHSPHPEPAILSDRSLQQLLTPVIATNQEPAPIETTQETEPETKQTQDGPASYYGYGLVHDQLFERRVIHHNGGIHGFRTVLMHYPTATLSVCVLSNFENASPEHLAKDLAAIVFGEDYKLPVEQIAVEIDPSLYTKYVGTYQLLPEMQVDIRIEANQLVAQATGQDSFVLYPSAETDFFAKVADITVTFGRDETNGVKGFTLTQMGRSLFAEKQLDNGHQNDGHHNNNHPE